MGRRLAAAALLIVPSMLAGACAPPTKTAPGTSMTGAESVTIIRDEWGIPHIYGPTDAGVVYGLTWARAEDRFERMEEFYLRCLGRAAEKYGQAGLAMDAITRANEVAARSKAEYERSDPKIRALCDAFAKAMNAFIAMHPARAKYIDRYEPWFALAGERVFWSLYGFHWHGISGKEVLDAVRASTGETPVEAPDAAGCEQGLWDDLACNEWAVAPAKSASGHALLQIDLHIPFDAAYEAGLHSDEGYELYGVTAYGRSILPIVGFNAHQGWAFTNNFPDWVDLYEETFDKPGDPLSYRYGDGYRRAEEWTETVKVKTDGGLREQTLTFRKTHHGPVLAVRDGKHIAVRVGKIAEGGQLRQFYAMGRARNLREFKAALDHNAINNQNVCFADRAGNIFYVYNGLIPKRDARFNWRQPVSGADPGTEWKGYHALGERPQVENPPSGFVQNCNSTPFRATVDGQNPLRGDFPRYLVDPRDGDCARAANARRVLAARDRFTFEQFAALPFDGFVYRADEWVPKLIAQWKKDAAKDPDRHKALAEVVEVVRAWDRRAAVDSVATTVFMLWFEAACLRKKAEPEWTDALHGVVEKLRADFGTWKVAWGEINRHQRVDRSRSKSFRDDRESLPAPGVDSSTGVLFAYRSEQPEGQKRRYGITGRGYAATIEFGPVPRARSILPYGQSDDPASAHWFDQAPLYVAGRMKPVHFAREDVEAHAVRSYHPGE